MKIAGAAPFPEPTPDACVSQPMTDVTPNSIHSVSSSDESYGDCGFSEGDDELEDFVFDTFLTGIEPDLLTVALSLIHI